MAGGEERLERTRFVLVHCMKEQYLFLDEELHDEERERESLYLTENRENTFIRSVNNTRQGRSIERHEKQGTIVKEMNSPWHNFERHRTEITMLSDVSLFSR